MIINLFCTALFMAVCDRPDNDCSRDSFTGSGVGSPPALFLFGTAGPAPTVFEPRPSNRHARTHYIWLSPRTCQSGGVRCEGTPLSNHGELMTGYLKQRTTLECEGNGRIMRFGTLVCREADGERMGGLFSQRVINRALGSECCDRMVIRFCSTIAQQCTMVQYCISKPCHE